MSRDLISKKTRYEFREHFVSIVLREIETEFDAADISRDYDYVPSVSGQRRALVEQHYQSIDWTKQADIQRILTVYGNVLSQLEGERPFQNSEWAQAQFHRLMKWLEKDGYRYEKGRLFPIARNQPLAAAKEKTAVFDAPELHRQIARMQQAVTDDPGLAIGTAKELIETACKTILEENEVGFSKKDDLMDLVKKVRVELRLLPDDVSDSSKGAESVRRILGSLGAIAQGLGELRNLYGTGHGKGRRSKGLSPRHAQLAVGAAATLATFLFETHQERRT